VADWPPLRALGDASYSLYLVHGLAISAAFRLLKMAGLDAPAIVLPTAIVAGVVGGFTAYYLLEKPLMRFFKTGMGARRPKTAPALAGGIAPASDA
jgi:exopolysaccharide production protein ExoZ